MVSVDTTVCHFCEIRIGRSKTRHFICKMDLFDGEFGSEESLCLSFGSLALCRFLDLREQTEPQIKVLPQEVLI